MVFAGLVVMASALELPYESFNTRCAFEPLKMTYGSYGAVDASPDKLRMS